MACTGSISVPRRRLMKLDFPAPFSPALQVLKNTVIKTFRS